MGNRRKTESKTKVLVALPVFLPSSRRKDWDPDAIWGGADMHRMMESAARKVDTHELQPLFS